jgi:hypothetical protein
MSENKPSLCDLFDSRAAQTAQKALDFLDGAQEQWVTKLLNDPQKGRRNWMQRGIIARHRNITRAIVEKSGLLFAQNPPRLALYAKGSDFPDVPNSEKLVDLFEEFDWIEFFNNFDTVVRLLKTALVLMQWDPVKSQLVPSILTQANSLVQCNPFNGEMQSVIVKMATEHNQSRFDTFDNKVHEAEKITYFRLFTVETITDISVDDDGVQTTLSTIANPFGIIPVTVFHDTVVPRADNFWNQGPHDLIAIQEMYNLHITDSEYAASYSKLKTLVTNARILQDSNDMPVTADLYGSSLPRVTMGVSGVVAGPGSVITIDSNGQAPFVQFMGPEPDLDTLDQMFQQWISNYAQDWSVNVKAGRKDNSQKTSGFQLVVEEIDNIQLRQRRQKMMTGGFSRLFDVVKTIVNTIDPGYFQESLDLDLFLEFAHPRLPIDQKDEEDVWDLRILGSRATILDYLMETRGFTRDEAIAKAKEIKAVNAGQLDYDPTAVVDAEEDMQEGSISAIDPTPHQTNPEPPEAPKPGQTGADE